MVTIFLKKYPSAKKQVAIHNYPPKERKRRKEPQSEIVLLEKRNGTYEGMKMPLKEFTSTHTETNN